MDSLRRLIELCHIQLFIWPGYPGLYRPLCELLHIHRHRADGLFGEPNDRRKRDLLQKHQWKAARPSMGNYKGPGAVTGTVTKSGDHGMFCLLLSDLTFFEKDFAKCRIM